MGYSRELNGVPVRSLKVRYTALAAECPIAKPGFLGPFFGAVMHSVGSSWVTPYEDGCSPQAYPNNDLPAKSSSEF